MTTGQLPRLVPLLDALTLQLPHVVVLADRAGADILAYTAGPDPVETEQVQSDRWPLHKTGRGGWSTKRYDATVHNNWQDNAKDVAVTVEKIAADKAPLDEVLVRAALGTRATVRFIGGGMEQAPAEGVGALLRYAD